MALERWMLGHPVCLSVLLFSLSLSLAPTVLLHSGLLCWPLFLSEDGRLTRLQGRMLVWGPPEGDGIFLFPVSFHLPGCAHCQDS